MSAMRLLSLLPGLAVLIGGSIGLGWMTLSAAEDDNVAAAIGLFLAWLVFTSIPLLIGARTALALRRLSRHVAERQEGDSKAEP